MWGLAPAAFFDSSFFSLAGGVDVWLISLCVHDPARIPLYVAAAAAGSVAGASALYFTVRKLGEAFTRNRLSSERMATVRRQVERYGSWALLVASLTPPPTPFKLFIIAAGLLRHPFEKFLLALLVGRTIRYSIEGFLAARYGEQTWQWLLRLGPWAVAAVLLAVAAILLGLKLRRRAVPSPR
jgi:membrane protein YqaA with SNARE-associated domain